MKLQFVAAALAVVAAPMAAQATEPTAGRRIDDPNKVTCRVTRPIGSRLGGTRTCRTAAEWAAYSAEMRDVVHRIQAEGATFCNPDPNGGGPRC